MKSPNKIALGLGLSYFGGLASGFLGIGGGVLGVPIMTLGMGIPIHFATATSMFTMILTSISGVTRHALAHHVHALPALLLAAGTVIGARAGADLAAGIDHPLPGDIIGAFCHRRPHPDQCLHPAHPFLCSPGLATLSAPGNASRLPKPLEPGPPAGIGTLQPPEWRRPMADANDPYAVTADELRQFIERARAKLG